VTRPISSLADVAGLYDVLFCDLWGCVHDGLTLFPPAVAALQAFRAGGGTVVLMTNAPRTQGAVARRLDQMGLPRDAWDVIVASGDATQEAMLNGAAGRRVWHLGPEKDDDLFADIPPPLAHLPPVIRVPLDEAQGIICTGPFDEFNETPADYRGRFLSAKARGLMMLNANPDLVVDVGETRIYCAGALAALYAEMGGRVMTFGKPHPPIYDLARRRLAERGRLVDDGRILVVGDGILTDVAGARGEGLDAIFLTGGLEATRFGPAPDAAQVAAWLAGQAEDPTYWMPRLK
jgi:HAD superfamily hydrolase (TIGR01459 family)